MVNEGHVYNMHKNDIAKVFIERDWMESDLKERKIRGGRAVWQKIMNIS